MGSASRAAPDIVRDLDDAREFALDQVARKAAAARDAGETALRRQRELLDGRVLAGLVDPALQPVGRFDLGELRGDEAEHRDLAFRQETQRREIAGARRVVFEEEAVDLEE